MHSNFRFCALVLAVSLCGCAHDKVPPPPPPPPVDPDPQVTLEIKQSNSGVSGWVTTYGSNGKMYVYRFTGGNKQHGNLEFKVGNGAANIHITLSASSNFAIKDVPINGNSNGQLTPTVENPNKAKIHDDNTDVLDAYYAVKVADSTVADIYCDPGIINNR